MRHWQHRRTHERRECCFCLQDIEDGAEFCGAPCRASWSLLFGNIEDRETTDEEAYGDADALELPLR